LTLSRWARNMHIDFWYWVERDLAGSVGRAGGIVAAMGGGLASLSKETLRQVIDAFNSKIHKGGPPAAWAEHQQAELGLFWMP
jgi:hypothetical protein